MTSPDRDTHDKDALEPETVKDIDPDTDDTDDVRGGLRCLGTKTPNVGVQCGHTRNPTT